MSKKQKNTLAESKLHNLVNSYVKKALRETSKDDDELGDFYNRFSKNTKKTTTDIMYDKYGNKNVKESVNRDLNRIIKESFKKVLNEDSSFWSGYDNMIRACTRIIFDTEKGGRRFTDRETGGLENDEEFVTLKDELLENMESYFHSTKRLLSYIAKRCKEDGEVSLAKEAEKWLSHEFTPQW